MSKERNKKIVIDARMINDSGIGIYIQNLLPSLIGHFQIILIGEKNILNFFFKSGVEIIQFNAKIYSIKEQILPIIVPRCDVYWSPHINIPFIRVRARKIITTIHDVNHIAFNNNFSKIKKIYSRLLYKNAQKKSNHIITVSKFSKSEIERVLNVYSNKISYIHNGVSKNFFNERSEFNDRINKYILFVGNVKPHKNLTILLNAYVNLPEYIKTEYKLMILGKKEGFITTDNYAIKFLENRPKESIEFTGYVEQKHIYSIYKNASLFVFPSLYEGFGLPLLEAMASQIKILCSDIPSLREIGLDTVNYFNPKDQLDLRNKIISILDKKNNQKEHIERAYLRAKYFTWENSSKKHIEIFKKILNE